MLLSAVIVHGFSPAKFVLPLYLFLYLMQETVTVIVVPYFT